jgi:3-oxo-5-alpha-steroid 4-dehydrogenase 1
MGSVINGKLAWFIQESISPLMFTWTFLRVNSALNISPIQWILLTVWIVHYLNRSVIYTIRSPGMSDSRLAVMLMAIGFNVINGYLNGVSLANYPPLEFSLQFLVGAVLWLLGFLINLHSDELLMELRRKSRTQRSGKSLQSAKTKKQRYSIPRGGLFEYVSCANYFGEILEWTGYALMASTAAGWSFALWTAANLIPRALTSHRWYLQQFGESYPSNRRAILPFCL